MIALLPPILYLAVVAVALLWARRAVRPVGALSATVLALLPLPFTGRALLSGRVYAPLDMLFELEPWASMKEAPASIHNLNAGDVTWQIVPWHQAVRWSWDPTRGGGWDWPLWNPFMIAGDLLQGSAQSAPYHPLNFLSLLLPLELSLTFQATAIFFAGALAAFLWTRELGCRPAAALLGAAGWTFCGFLVFWLLWPLGATVAVFPLLTLGVRRVVRRPGARSASILGVALAWVLLGGHPQSMLFVVALAALYGLAELGRRAWRHRWPTPRTLRDDAGPSSPWKRLLRPVGWAVAAGAAAGSLAAIHLLPIVQALPQSVHYDLRRRIWEGVDRSAPLADALGRMLTAALPHRFGLTWRGEQIPIPGDFFVPPSSAYVGSVLFGLVLYAIWRRPSAGRLALLTVAFVGIAAGASLPGVTHVLTALPVFDLTVHRRWVFAGAWALSTLAALGAESWARNPREDRTRLLVSHAAALTGVTFLVWENWSEMATGGLSQAFLWRHGAWLLVPPALAVAVLWPRIRVGADAERRLLALLLLLVIQRSGEAGDRYPTLDRELSYPRPPLLELLPDDLDHPDGGPARFVATGLAMTPNSGVFWGLEDVRGYQPMALRRFAQTYPLWTERTIFINRVDSLEPHFLDLLGVRWAVEDADVSPPPGWRSLGVWKELRVLENLEAFPRAFVPEEVRLDGPPTLTALRRASEEGSLRRVAFVDTPAEDRSHPPLVANGPGTVTTRRVKPTALRLDADLEDDAWVVVVEPAFEGWRASEVDTGEEIPLHRADHAFLALRLPTGEHDVLLRFLPRSFVVGRWISGAALFVLLLLWVMRRRMPRSTLC